ncbi:MAG: LysM peptidoglycan-binding domain-containing protein [Candidatus Aminicenantes bacterium]|nr:LysM peptidoglycan-binding domain-containing protein [Candidatus Aminicenantes bacterium]
MRRLGIGLFVLLTFGPLFAQSTQDPVIEIRIARGETLGSIARTYLANPGDWREVARINRLADPNVLTPGQVLVIPVRLLKEAPGEAVVTFVKGTAEVRAGEGAPWTPLALGAKVPERSAVRTGEASSLEITFENGDSCFLRPRTTLGLSSLQKRGGSFFHQLFLQMGKVVTRVRKATGAESRFEIRTPSAQCAARGTEFRTSVGEDGMSRLEILEGGVSVEAAAKRVDVAEGYGTAVKPGEAPLPPRPLLPAPVATSVEPVYKSVPFGLLFERMSGAAGLVAALSTDADGKSEVFFSRFAAENAFRVIDVPDGLYFLHARAVDEIGLEGFPSKPLEIRVRTRPRPPAIPIPAEGSAKRAGTMTFSWPGAEGADRYHVQLAEDAGFSRLAFDEILSQPVWTITRYAGPVFLRAASIAPDGFESAWSPVFRVDISPPLAPPALDKPDVGKKDVFLSWKESGQGLIYRVQISSRPNFEVVIHDLITRGLGLSFPKPNARGLYYARVQAVDFQGAESPFSEPVSFRISRGWAGFFTPCLLFLILEGLVYLLLL